MRKSLRYPLVILASFLAWTVAAESLSSYWIRRWGDPLDKARPLLVEDGRLGWRQKENLKTRFLGARFTTNEWGLRERSISAYADTAKNIVILGPSSTVGWGVEAEHTYAFLLQALLRKLYPDAAINVINAGQIGFSSWQGLTFYAQSPLGKLGADIVISAYGVNDVDRFRFFSNSARGDNEEFALPRAEWKICAANVLARLNCINLLSRWLRARLASPRHFKSTLPVRRVDHAAFAENIGGIIRKAKADGARIILLNSAYRLPSFAPADPEKERRGLRHFEEGINKYRKSRYAEAQKDFCASLRIDPEQNEVYYYLASCCYYLGEPARAEKMLAKARATESRRIAGDLEGINAVLALCAAREGVELVDARECLKGGKDPALFFDAIHLSPAGHALIADELAAAIYGRDLLKLNKRLDKKEG